MKTRMKELKAFFPDAREGDWRLIDAGIRVQAIKKEDGDAGIVAEPKFSQLKTSLFHFARRIAWRISIN